MSISRQCRRESSCGGCTQVIGPRGVIVGGSSRIIPDPAVSRRGVHAQLDGKVGQQLRLVGLTQQPVTRGEMDPAALAPDHHPGASARPAATPPIDRVIAQQQVQHGSGLALDKADPIDGAGPRAHGPVQDPAQCVTQELVAGLIDGPAPASHGHHTGTVCDAAAGTRS